MKCFKHNDRDAVGICSACHKGLCPDCHVSVADSSSCRGGCEGRVEDAVSFVRRNIEISKRIEDEYILIYRNRQRIAGAWAMALGATALFFIYKFVVSLSGDEPQVQYIWLLVITSVLVHGAMSMFLTNRRLAKNRQAVQSK